MSKQIMFDSAEAATHRTNLEGWVSRHGNYYGDGEYGERAARFDGCTHRACDGCGEPSEKNYIHCKNCRHEKDVARYEAMPYKEWNGKTPLYSNRLDEYIFDGIDEYLDEQKANGDLDDSIDNQSLMLVICEPVTLTPIDEENWFDDLPEDYDLPDEAAQALGEFNKILAECGTVSWRPGKYRTNFITKKESNAR